MGQGANASLMVVVHRWDVLHRLYRSADFEDTLMNALTIHAPRPEMTVSDVERVANAIAKGGLFGSRDPNAVLTLCLLAQAEGQHPAVVFRDYHIISGKPAKKADAMLRDFITSGGKVEWHQLDDTCADATFSHPSGKARIEWTIKRAQQAGIANPMWKKYPRQMLRSRVISEGVRTVYPGATSGLYEVEEVQSMEPAAAAEPIDITPTREPDLSDDGPSPPEKVPGISKIKKALNALMLAGNKATDLEAFNKLVHDNKDDLSKIKEGNHAYWTGDGEDSEGFKAWIVRRRAELSQPEDSLGLQMLLSALEECACRDDLNSLLDQHEAVADALSDVESRTWGKAYDAREAAILAMSNVSAG
jgi:hypothetical protein